ncbi:MAG: Ig-like domain-containing protein [Corynebacterium sp.]|uniref:Ig-like domain-containing protein n=1 Tax=Corynebacterium sp. TaxID=1720 RepID=UPI0026DA7EDA|nr:Ig-like domain-containing protein [Corynebacterium sp.]MDO4761408.1 Ig-like domain-containing protein [Corynebacterium sp.]
MAFKRGRRLAFTLATVLGAGLMATPTTAEETTVNVSMYCSSKADKTSSVYSKDGLWNSSGQEIEATFKVDAPSTAELGSVFDYKLKPVKVSVKNKKWVVDDTWYSWGYSVEFLKANFGRYRINLPEGVVSTPEISPAQEGVKASADQSGRFVIVGGEHTTDNATVPAEGPAAETGHVSGDLVDNALASFPEVNLKLQANALGEVKPSLPVSGSTDRTANAEKSFFTTKALWAYTTRGKTEQAPVLLRCITNNVDLPSVTIVPKSAEAIVQSVSLTATPNPALAGQPVQVTGKVTWEGDAPENGSAAKVIVNGEEHNVPVSKDGNFTHSFTPDKAGTISLKAVSGEKESDPIELKVNPDRSVRTLQLEATPQRITEGETVTVNVKALDRENNPAEVDTITINDGTTDHTVAKTGEAFTLTLTPKKTTTIQAISGTVRSNTQRITVDPRPAKPVAIDVKATPAEVTVGQGVKLSAEITYDDGAPKPLPSVVFTIDGKEIEVNRQPGTNLYRTTFVTNTPGTYPYSVKATDELSAQGVVVVKNRVAAAIAPAITVQEKQAQISFTVTDVTSKPVAGQTVTVNVGDNSQEVVTNAQGVATVTVQREEKDQSVHAQIGELVSESVVVPAVQKAPDLTKPTGVALQVDPVIVEPGQDVKVTARLTYGDGFIHEPATLRLLVGDQEVTATPTGQPYTYEAMVKAPQSGVHKVRVEVAENVFAEARIVAKAGEGEDQLGVPAKVDVDVDKHNDNYRVTATVTDAAGDVVPNHEVTFTIGEAQQHATTNYEGKATITVAPGKEATTVIAKAGDITAQAVEIPAQPQSSGLWWKILLGVAGVGALIAALVGLAKQFGLDRYLPKF